MQVNNKNITLFVLSIVAMVSVILFISKDKKDDAGNKVNEFTINQISTSSEIKIDGSKSKPSIKAPAIPDLARLIISDAVTADTRVQLTSQIKETSDILKNNPGSFDNWILLGSFRKMAGDYEGARVAWEYASVISPFNYASFSNLGDLYHYYLKDYPRAEKNMLISVKNKPDNIAGYRNLYNLYTQSYLEKTSEAPKILLSGLGKNPGNLDLLVLLAQYYAGIGDKINAVKYYELGIAKAGEEGNIYLKQSLEVELSALK